jgi:uncharacterized protein YbjT (DUF2867 family)
VIRAPGAPDPPVRRLLGALEKLPTSAGSESETLVLGAGSAPDLESLDAEWSTTAPARILVLSALGAHPDARAERLRRLWDVEERARGSGHPVLTLRLAPLLGSSSPLWLKLRSRPVLRGSDVLLQPVVEEDVVETLARALDGRAAWSGWHEVAGPEVLSLGELAAIASRAPQLQSAASEWEPPAAELREQGLAEYGPWSRHFDLAPRAVTEQARRWS